MKAIAKVAALSLIALVACSQPDFVDRITIVNDTDYPADVDVSDEKRSGWLGLTVVESGSRSTVEEVLDQGEGWIFRFDYAGEHAEEVAISRRELQATNWTVEVPDSFGARLKDMGVPPPP